MHIETVSAPQPTAGGLMDVRTPAYRVGSMTPELKALVAKWQQYSPKNGNPGNRKLLAMIGNMIALLQQGALEPALVDAIIEEVESEYQEFNEPDPAPKGWKTKRSIQLLYSPTVKVDRAYQKRAERHVRGLIKWEQMYREAVALFGTAAGQTK